MDLAHGLGNGYTERSVAVHNGDADLGSCDLSVEVPRREALVQQFNAMHPIVGKTIPRIVF